MSVKAKDFPRVIPSGHGAYVREGPAVVEKGRIILKDVPRRRKGPMSIVVITYDLARKETPVQTIYRLEP